MLTIAEAAALLGVPPSKVLADVIRGMKPRGNLPHLIGDREHVAKWELEGERLKIHRARLADGDSLAP